MVDFLDKTLGLFAANRSNHKHKRRPYDHVHTFGISVINHQRGKSMESHNCLM